MTGLLSYCEARKILFPLFKIYIGRSHMNNNPQGVSSREHLQLTAGGSSIWRRNFKPSAQTFSFSVESGQDKASSGGEDSRSPRKISLYRGADGGKGKFRRRKFKASAKKFSFLAAPGTWYVGGKEKIAGFWRRFLFLPGTRSVARWSEREDSRILEKISPFAWH